MTVLRSLPLNVRTLFLYAQDTHGMGHVTRTLTIARHVLARYPNAVAYVATASPVAGQFALPPRCDYIKLPTLLTPDGVRLAPPQEEDVKRHFRRLRGAILRDAVLGLEPDVVLVDHEPLGAKGEFADGLAALKAQRPETRFVFGLRDIMDDTVRIRAQWRELGVYEALEHLYDGIAVYGSPALYDVAEAYGIPPCVRPKLHYCGYDGHGRDIAHDIAAVVELGPDARRDSLGFRDVVQRRRAVHRNAVVQVLERLVHPQLAPLGANAHRVVHDVPQAEHEPRLGTLRLERSEPFREFSLGAQRLVVHEHHVRLEAQHRVPQDRAAEAAEVPLHLLFLWRREAHPVGGEQGWQFDVVTPRWQGELARHGRRRRDVGDRVRVPGQHVAGNRESPGDVPQAMRVLRIQKQGADIERQRPQHRHAIALRRRGHRHARGGAVQQARHESADAVETAEIEALADGGWGAEVARQPRGERAGAERVGVQHLNQAQIAQALGANPLLRLRRDPRHDERVLLERQDLAARVVAAHGDHPVGPLDQRDRLGHEVQDADVGALLRVVAHPLALFPRHEGARHAHNGHVPGPVGLEKRPGQRFAVVPAAHETERDLARRQAFQHGVAPGRGEVEAGPLVEISRVARLGRHVGAEPVLAHGVEHGRIAVDPYGVVEVPDGLQVGPVGPGASHRPAVVQHLAQPDHAARVAARAQAVERGGELARDAERQVVHDQHVGVEHFDGAADDAGAQGDQVLVGHVQQEARVVRPVGLAAQRRQRDAVHTLG